LESLPGPEEKASFKGIKSKKEKENEKIGKKKKERRRRKEFATDGVQVAADRCFGCSCCYQSDY